MRLFVSVDLSPDLAEPVRTIQEQFDEIPSITLVDPTQVHLTLKFIGDTDPNEVSTIETTIREGLSKLNIQPFKINIEGLGVFPSPDYIQVLWLGVTRGSEELTKLHSSLDSSLSDIGVDPEPHDFTPHVTIGRMQDARGKSTVQELLDSTSPHIGTMEVDDIRLKKSELTPSGPNYTTVTTFPLE